MTDRKVPTIDIGRGVSYATVAARTTAFHGDNAACTVETSCEFKEGFVLFCAKVTTSKGTFTGHSMDKISGRQKQFEKQETIAVGRALAFAGYLASGDIACAEEMADVVTAAQLNSLKLRFSKLHATELDGLDRAAKQKVFRSWACGIIGEDADYSEPSYWAKEWYQACWTDLTGVDDSVPFEA